MKTKTNRLTKPLTDRPSYQHYRSDFNVHVLMQNTTRPQRNFCSVLK